MAVSKEVAQHERILLHAIFREEYDLSKNVVQIPANWNYTIIIKAVAEGKLPQFYLDKLDKHALEERTT